MGLPKDCKDERRSGKAREEANLPSRTGRAASSMARRPAARLARPIARQALLDLLLLPQSSQVSGRWGLASLNMARPYRRERAEKHPLRSKQAFLGLQRASWQPDPVEGAAAGRSLASGEGYLHPQGLWHHWPSNARLEAPRDGWKVRSAYFHQGVARWCWEVQVERQRHCPIGH